MKKKFFLMLAGCLLALVSTMNAATIADIVIVVDESGSMAGEHAWLPGMVNSLSTKLAGLGYTANFGLIGYGNGISGSNNGRMLLNAGTAAQFATAAGSLVVSGGTEDGYAGINYASSNYTFTGGSARNYILVTDEDRDVTTGDTFASMSTLLSGQSALLNAVVDNAFGCTGGGTGSVIGRTTGNGYRVGAGGTYTACSTPTTGAGFGTTGPDYVTLALGTKGAGWNLNILRNGGNDAASFTAAFVDIKVAEIVTQTGVPEPASYLLGGSALVGFALLRRRKR